MSSNPNRASRTSPLLLVGVAAVLLVAAIVALTQFGGQRDMAPTPSGSASAVPSGASPSGSPSSAPPASAARSDAGSADELVLRVKSRGHTTGGPELLVTPEFTLMGDGTVVWLPIQTSVENPPTLVTRQLTADGLAELRELIFGSGYLDESASYELERRPEAGEPLGHGVAIYTFTAESADGEPVVVTSVQWLGEVEESTYYQPAPEREELDGLAQQLRDPESMLGGDAWAGPARGYEAADYVLVLFLTPNVPPFNGTDASEIRWPFDGPLDAFGEPSQVVEGRCGIVASDAAGAMVTDLQDAGGLAGMALAFSNASLDWAEGNGQMSVFLLPRMPDGYPSCEDLP